MYDNYFEKYPGSNINSEPSEADLARADEWQSAMSAEDTPAFAGDISISEEAAETGAAVKEGTEINVKA